MDKNINANVDKLGSGKREPEFYDQKELPTHYFNRYSLIRNIPGGWFCTGRPEAVTLTVSRNISLVGCQLYGPYNSPESIYRLNVVLYDDQDQVIAQPLSNTDRKLRGFGELNDVMFPDPVPLMPGRTYTIRVNMTGEGTYYGIGGQSSVTVDGVTFTFSNSKYSTYTKCESGQIPGLIWR